MFAVDLVVPKKGKSGIGPGSAAFPHGHLWTAWKTLFQRGVGLLWAPSPPAQGPLPSDEEWKGENYLVLSLWNKSVSPSPSVALVILNMGEQLLVLACPYSSLLCIATFGPKKCRVTANLSCFIFHSLHIVINCCLVSFSSVLQRCPRPGFSLPVTGDAFCVYYPTSYSCISARAEYGQYSHLVCKFILLQGHIGSCGFFKIPRWTT